MSEKEIEIRESKTAQEIKKSHFLSFLQIYANIYIYIYTFLTESFINNFQWFLSVFRLRLVCGTFNILLSCLKARIHYEIFLSEHFMKCVFHDNFIV